MSPKLTTYSAGFVTRRAWARSGLGAICDCFSGNVSATDAAGLSQNSVDSDVVSCQKQPRDGDVVTSESRMGGTLLTITDKAAPPLPLEALGSLPLPLAILCMHTAYLPQKNTGKWTLHCTIPDLAEAFPRISDCASTVTPGTLISY